ncbi:hypothetical protein IV38_GL001225 [Lactobacillus selangorensis]|uniref:Uncharacterized protein n=1 Tax=Lactobacillus selangorensis TaxID=81857 RepID=A0A0R2FK68_9LACO|nr:hypothetical protein IV38_GL001225 [Lactobacillus selangorensis]KRN32579.1 hypothetical protein IV40_GL000628 [Lactobacillus selangorensis]
MRDKSRVCAWKLKRFAASLNLDVQRIEFNRNKQTFGMRLKGLKRISFQAFFAA